MRKPEEIEMDFLSFAGADDADAAGGRKRQAIAEFLAEESGQDQLEFALVAALLGLSAIVALKELAADVLWLWQSLATNLASSI